MPRPIRCEQGVRLGIELIAESREVIKYVQKVQTARSPFREQLYKTQLEVARSALAESRKVESMHLADCMRCSAVGPIRIL